MKNWKKCIILAAVLLGMIGCTHTSEANVNIVNKGELTTYVKIYYSSSRIPAGGSDIYTLSWPGRDTIDLIMVSYPVGQDFRVEYQSLALKDGDNITVNVEFMAN
ncbi:MAG TPA: hypothetical protein VMZ49_05905 [Patescibacteria group bacterium]|nr:hypothetical protein [Patescibacteria group bacterium]